MIVYVNGKYLKEDEALVRADDRANVFADGAYEGFRIYNNKIFKLKEHKTRFQRSLDELKIDYKLNNEIEEIYSELFRKNSYKNEQELFLYMQISRGAAPRDHAFPKEKPKASIYAFLCEKKINLFNHKNGINVCTRPDNRWARCDIKCISLIANCLTKQDALENGFDDALFVHDGVITEGTATNAFFVKDNIVYTHGATNRILSGVTRNFVIELCYKNKIEVREFPVTFDKLYSMDEAFLTGTTQEITPIVKIDNKTIGTGQAGKISKKLQIAFKEYLQKNFL